MADFKLEGVSWNLEEVAKFTEKEFIKPTSFPEIYAGFEPDDRKELMKEVHAESKK